MSNPKYYRLMRDGRLAGFKRVVVEYNAAGSEQWKLGCPEGLDEYSLTSAPMGVAALKRETIRF